MDAYRFLYFLHIIDIPMAAELVALPFPRAAAMTLRTVLLSLQALLAAAEPDDPQDAVVASQYKCNRELFTKTAEYWTAVYAGGEGAFTRMVSLIIIPYIIYIYVY